MLYFQEPLIEKLPAEEPKLEEAKHLAEKYLQLCLEERKKVNEDEKGVFTIKEINSVKKEILKGQVNIPKFISEKRTTEINTLKPSFFSGMMSYTGILGYYNPFTAEAQYNSQIPSTSLPFTLAHESAHQLGFAREQEANFIAFLIGLNSNSHEIKYSTYYFVLKSLLNNIYLQDEAYVSHILRKYSPEMQRDRNYEKKFMADHEGYLDDFFGFTNNLFLQFNQQEGSITYSYFVDLLIRYERVNKE